jgi:hypothetical protein
MVRRREPFDFAQDKQGSRTPHLGETAERLEGHRLKPMLRRKGAGIKASATRKVQRGGQGSKRGHKNANLAGWETHWMDSGSRWRSS